MVPHFSVDRSCFTVIADRESFKVEDLRKGMGGWLTEDRLVVPWIFKNPHNSYITVNGEDEFWGRALRTGIHVCPGKWGRSQAPAQKGCPLDRDRASLSPRAFLCRSWAPNKQTRQLSDPSSSFSELHAWATISTFPPAAGACWFRMRVKPVLPSSPLRVSAVVTGELDIPRNAVCATPAAVTEQCAAGWGSEICKLRILGPRPKRAGCVAVVTHLVSQEGSWHTSCIPGTTFASKKLMKWNWYQLQREMQAALLTSLATLPFVTCANTPSWIFTWTAICDTLWGPDGWYLEGKC